MVKQTHVTSCSNEDEFKRTNCKKDSVDEGYQDLQKTTETVRIKEC